VKHYRN